MIRGVEREGRPTLTRRWAGLCRGCPGHRAASAKGICVSVGSSHRPRRSQVCAETAGLETWSCRRLRQARTWTPSEPACYRVRADCAISTPMHDLAHAKAFFDRAMALLRAGDARSAEHVCVAALEEFPNDANLLALLGAVYRKQ